MLFEDTAFMRGRQVKFQNGLSTVTHVHVALQNRRRQIESPHKCTPYAKVFVMAETWHTLLLGPLKRLFRFSRSLLPQPIGNRRKNNHMEGSADLGTPLWG
jgi:hypothetical protein